MDRRGLSDLDKMKVKHWKTYRTLERKARSDTGINEKEAHNIIDYHRLHGAGFFDSIKNKVKDFFSYRKAFSTADSKTYEQNKNKRIVKLFVVRTPLGWFTQTFADIASLGTFSDQAKKLGYDRVYHLYALIYLEGVEQPLLYEKNETVVLRFGSPTTGEHTQMKQVSVPGNMTLEKFITNAQKQMGDEEYWHYTFDKMNCQRFLMLNLKANNMLTPELEKFILQDASQLLKKAPIAQKFAQGMADTSAFLRKLTGRGLEQGGMMPIKMPERKANPSSDIEDILRLIRWKFDTTTQQDHSLRIFLRNLPLERRTYAEAEKRVRQMGIPQFDSFLLP
jgi:hypothetical protein